MKNIFFGLLLWGSFVTVSAAELETGGLPAGVMTPSEEAVTLVHQGDAIFATRTETTGAQDAVADYEKALQKDPTLVEALWKASRAAHWIGDHSDEKKEKYVWFEKGIEYAKKSIQVEPRSVEAHFWLGANYGSYGEAKGVLKSLSLVKPIRREMETVVRLDDNFQGGGGYRVLGVVDYKVPSFAGGSKSRALENLNKAMGIDSTNPFNLYYLAEYYDVIGDRYKALDNLALLEKLTATPEVDEADLKSIQEKGKKLKKKLG
jgi:tetratricopeptide (TPR) repeat protein